MASATTASTPVITHPDRVVYADPPLTKQDVADYYMAVAEHILPGLVGRPLSVLRCPDGSDGTCFFQKHPGALGDGVKSRRLREKDGSDDYLYIDDAEGLLQLVQMNVLEFHPWGARIDDPEHPECLVFDLDPAPGIAWSRLIEAAREVRKRLRAQGLQSFVRLSGGKGVHVVAPIRRGASWEDAKAFCDDFAHALANDQPDAFLATASKAKREGRIFIDWLRNARGATSVASWSLRARAGAAVAMPLRWEDLGATSGPAMFDLAGAKRRAASLRKDPWAGFETLDQALPKQRRSGA